MSCHALPWITILYGYPAMRAVRTQRFAARPDPPTHHALDRLPEPQRHLRTPAFEVRIDAYRTRGKSITAYDRYTVLGATPLREHGARSYVEDLQVVNMVLVKNHRLAPDDPRTEPGRLRGDAHRQRGRRWWAGAQDASARSVADALGVRSLARGSARAGGARVPLHELRACRGPRHQCGKDHALGRAHRRPGVAGMPGVPGGRGSAGVQTSDGRGVLRRHETASAGGLTIAASAHRCNPH